MSRSQNIPGFVSLDKIGKGMPYVLAAGQGEHIPVHGGIRSLLTRKEDTNGHVGVAECSGDVAPATKPHYHHNTTEAVYVLDGVVRVWQDDQKGTRIVRDLGPGSFGLLPAGWTHAWAFAAPKTRFLAIFAPGGFEGTLHFLAPDEPTSLRKLREIEQLFDVVWLPDFPLFGQSENPGA
jgi:quercetin 2,3-dioxygenase